MAKVKDCEEDLRRLGIGIYDNEILGLELNTHIPAQMSTPIEDILHNLQEIPNTSVVVRSLGSSFHQAG